MLTGAKQISSQQITATSTSKDTASLIGDLAVTRDGSWYRYSFNGTGATLVPGQVTVAAAKVANHTAIAVDALSAVAVGSRVLTVDLGATAATANQYQDGFLVVITGTGAGQTYQIAGNSAGALSTSITVTLVEPLTQAITTSSTVSLVYNKYQNVLVHPGSSASYQPTGIPEVSVPVSTYYWSKTRGYGSVLADGVTAKGINAVLTTNATPGAVITLGSNTTVPAVGYAPEATVSTNYSPLFLTVD